MYATLMTKSHRYTFCIIYLMYVHRTSTLYFFYQFNRVNSLIYIKLIPQPSPLISFLDFINALMQNWSFQNYNTWCHENVPSIR